MPIQAHCYGPVIWTSKVGQGDLVFDVRSKFASGFCAYEITSLCTAIMSYATLVVPKLIHVF